MATRKHVNNFSTTINGAINNSVTTIVLTSTTGLPALSGGDFFYLTLVSGTTYEIVKVTAWSVLTLTVVRAQEGTSAVSWVDASVITLNATANSVDRKADAAASSTDTAFARWSGTGGNILQNSVVTCDGSGNLANVGTLNGGTPLTSSTPVTVAQGGTGITTASTHLYAPICTGTTATGAVQIADTGMSTAGYVFMSNGASALPSFQVLTGAVSGPVSTTNNGIVTWNGTGGGTINTTTATVSAAGIITTTADASINTLNIGLGGVTSGTQVATNTAIGLLALANTSTANKTVAVGWNAATANNTGLQNVYVGYQSGAATTSGQDNCFVGYQSGLLISTPGSITAIGSQALGNVPATTSSAVTAIGFKAGRGGAAAGMQSCVLIGDNVAGNALAACATTVAIGSSCCSATTGASQTVVGYTAGTAITSGTSNTFMGAFAGSTTTTGLQNVGIGHSSLRGMTTAATSNTAVGMNTGQSGATGAVTLLTGSGNTLLGYQACGNAAACLNAIAIGRDAVTPIATGATNITNGPGIAIGSAAFPVGFRGDGVLFPTASTSTVTPPATVAGFWQVVVNGTAYKLALYVV